MGRGLNECFFKFLIHGNRQNKIKSTLEFFTKKKTGAMRTTSVDGKKFSPCRGLAFFFGLADIQVGSINVV